MLNIKRNVYLGLVLSLTAIHIVGSQILN